MVPHPGDNPRQRPDHTHFNEIRDDLFEDKPAEIDGDLWRLDERFHRFLCSAHEFNVGTAQETAAEWAAMAERLHAAGRPLLVREKTIVPYKEGSFSSFSLDEQEWIMDFFLDLLVTKESIRMDDIIQRLCILIAQGDTSEQFAAKMKALDYSLKCNDIWYNDAVAYRCNTCALNPCMSLCQACFESADHEGHEYNRFFSKEGGACDCGNTDVIKLSGCCYRHGEDAIARSGICVETLEPPAMALYVLYRVVARLLDRWRRWRSRLRNLTGEEEEEAPQKAINMFKVDIETALPAIAFLQMCVQMGGPMRIAMSQVFLDCASYSVYTNIWKHFERYDPDAEIDASEVQKSLRESNGDTLAGDIVGLILKQDGKTCVVSSDILRCDNFLHEMMFWIVRQNFPQETVNLVLSMLSEKPYDLEFACRFFSWYPVITETIEKLCYSGASVDYSMMASRIIHISVQMLSSQKLCVELEDRLGLSGIMLGCLQKLVSSHTKCLQRTLYPAIVGKPPIGLWNVMDVRHNLPIMAHAYWYVLGDVQNMLAHHTIALGLIRNSSLLNDYMKTISYLQGMEVMDRIVQGPHIEFDDVFSDVAQSTKGEMVFSKTARYLLQVTIRSFGFEYEMITLVAWNLVNAVAQKAAGPEAVTFASVVIAKLKEWFVHLDANRGNLGDLKQCFAFNVTFHLPLHRHLAMIVTYFASIPEMKPELDALRANKHFLQLLFLHPMRIQAVRAEYQAGLWVRNGGQLRVFPQLYTQHGVIKTFQQPDMDLMRFVAANVDPDWIIESVESSFHLDDVFLISHPDNAMPKPPESGLENCLPESLFTMSQRFDDNTSEQKSIPTISVTVNSPKVLTRHEWVDGMALGALKLLEELLVLRAGAGESLEETMRRELVCMLASDKSTYSKLKAVLTDRTNTLDAPFDEKLFDKLLDEVAEFKDADDSYSITQRMYQLKDEALWNHFDPVLFNHRTTSPRLLHKLYSKLAEMERSRKPSNYGSDVWMPFQVQDFHSQFRHETMVGVGELFTSGRFFEFLMKMVLFTQTQHFGPALEREEILQHVVYLLSLAASYAKRLSPERQRAVHQHFLRVYRLKGVNRSQPPREYSLFTYMIERLYCHIEKTNQTVQVFKSIRNREYEQVRIFGGRIEYIGRLISLLMCVPYVDKAVSTVIRQTLAKSEEVEDAEAEVGQKLEKDRLREAARKRRDAMLAAQKKKNDARMNRLMEKEGLSQVDMDAFDISQPDTRLWNCPLCNSGGSPSTLAESFGILVRCNEPNWIHAYQRINGVPHTVLDADDIAIEKRRPRNTRRLYFMEKEIKSNRMLFHFDWNNVSPPVSGVELKSCGHEMHIDCFDSYRASLFNLHAQEGPERERHREVNCPVCRYPVTGILPTVIDFPFETTTHGIDNDLAKAFDMFQMIQHSKREFENESEEEKYMELVGDRLMTLIDLMPYWIPTKMTFNVEHIKSSMVASIISAQLQRMVIYGDHLKTAEHRDNITTQNHASRRKGRLLVVEQLLPCVVALRQKMAFTINLLGVAKDLFVPQLDANIKSECSANDPTQMSSENAMGDSGPGTSADDLINEDDLLTAEELRILSPKVAKMELEKDEKSDKTWLPDNDVPLLLVDQRSMLVQLVAFTVGAQISTEDKIHLTRLLVRQVLGVYLIQSLLRQVVTWNKSALDGHLQHAPIGHPVELARRDVIRSVLKHNDCSAVLSETENADAPEAAVFESVNKGWESMHHFASLLLRATGLFTNVDVDPLDSADATLRQSALIFDYKQVQYYVDQSYPTLRWTHASFGEQPLDWDPMIVLRLPQNYDDIFNRYYRRPCAQCQTTPANPLVCLLCGEVTCLEEMSNYDNQRMLDADIHTYSCGGGSCVFLSVTTTVVVVIVDRKAIIWGTPYLDAHGEEDRNLKRGKPLFLSEMRMSLLRREWLTQEFRVHPFRPSAILSGMLRESHLMS